MRGGAPVYRLVRPARAAPGPPDLDAAQRRVVEHDGGPLMVLAGPGTGKTTTLVEAVVDRVRRGVPVENILVLTFGQRAAGELRDRITARLDMTVREPVARTFHSYAFGVLRMAVLPGGPPPRLLSAAEQDIILRDLIAGDVAEGRSPWPDHLTSALGTRGFVVELRDLLLRAAERGVDGAALAGLGRRLSRPEWRAAGAFLEQYRDVTTFDRPGAYDAAELIQAAHRALDLDPALLARERARRRHIFVDEYQDTDPAQADLLALICAGAEELILVGDPDQSIYAFRGADPEAMRGAGDRFGLAAFQEATGQLFPAAGVPAGLPTVELITSRRSGPVLLAATRRIAANLPGPPAHRALIPAVLVAARPDEVDVTVAPPPDEVDVTVLRSASEEAATVAARLRRAHLDEGVPWARMAVIVRSTAQTLAVLRRGLITAGVPVATSAEDLPLGEQNAVGQLLSVLQWVVRPAQATDELAETLLLGAIGDADALYLRRIRRELRILATAGGEPATDDLIVAVLSDASGPSDSSGPSNHAALNVLPPRLRAPLARVAAVLDAGRRELGAGGSAEDVLWAIWSASGLAPRWERRSVDPGPVGAAANQDLDAVIDLFAAAARLADRLPGATADALYDYVMAQQVPGEAWARGADVGAGAGTGAGVQILTAHASKGLEWDVVCVAGVQEGRWPDLRHRGSLLGSEYLVDVAAGRASVSELSTLPLLAEERRLFYVAITRARRRLYVTAVLDDDEQPSRFLDEIDPLPGHRAVQRPGRGLHLGDLVAELRGVVTDPHAGDALRDEAARHLARLAQSRVPGADPSQWWGLVELSDDRGLIDADQPAQISPSRIDAYLTCALKTFLDSAGAQEDSTVKARLGTAVHEIAELAGVTAELAELEKMMDDRWPGLDFDAPWYARTQRKRASAMLARLADWLAVSRDELRLIGQEVPFSVRLDDVELRGSVDRLEADADGRLVVIDFKTGSTAVPGAKLEQHAQLGAYQLAVELGGFPDATVERLGQPGGARLVQLGVTTSRLEQAQEPLTAAADPEWIRPFVREAAGLQRGHRFDATVNPLCPNCPVRTACPAQAGGQVTQE